MAANGIMHPRSFSQHCRTVDLFYLLTIVGVALLGSMVWMDKRVTCTRTLKTKEVPALFSAPSYLWHPHAIDKSVRSLPAAPSRIHLLGTDDRGRDILSRLGEAALRDFSFAVISILTVFAAALMLGAVPFFLCLPFIQSLLADPLALFSSRLLGFSHFLRPLCRSLPVFFLAAALAENGLEDATGVLIIWICYCWSPIAYQAEYWIGTWANSPANAAAVSTGATIRQLVQDHLLPYLVPRLCALIPRLGMESIAVVSAFAFLGLGSRSSAASFADFFYQYQQHPEAWWLLAPALILLVGFWLFLAFLERAVRFRYDVRIRDFGQEGIA